MRYYLLAVIAVAALAFTQQTIVNPDLDKFQGSWQATYVVNLEGKRAPEEEVKDTRLTVEGTKFVLQTKDSVIKGSFTLESSRVPKAIDVILAGQKPEEKLLGIYRVDGDERHSCFALPGKDRPTQLEPKTPGFIYFGWKRVP
jgi:uncharacterized protein (TIGR03067 family)